MKITKKGLLIVILFLTIGFAAITTTLTITGTITIKPNNENFENNVIFTDATTDSGTATVSDDGKSFTFTTSEFKTIGDSATVSFTIANNSNYVAVLGSTPVTCVGTGTNAALFSDYIKVETNTALASSEISRSGSVEGTLTASMKKSYTGDAATVTYTCTMAVSAEEATN